MQEFLKDKKIKVSVFILLVIVSVFTITKIINEIKSTEYIGKDFQYSNTISVSGTADVTAVADIASLTINLNKEGITAKEAQTLLNESITKTLSYLKEQKIEDKDIKSEFGGVSPKYSYSQSVCYTYPCPSKDPKIVGYTASQSITVKVREVDNASVIRTGLTAIGVTDINGPTFEIDDEDGFKAEARALAIKDAQEKAKVLAKDLGVKLGKIVSFNEEGQSNNFPMYKSVSADTMLSSVGEGSPILPKGENKITSNVTITYTIK